MRATIEYNLLREEDAAKFKLSGVSEEMHILLGDFASIFRSILKYGSSTELGIAYKDENTPKSVYELVEKERPKILVIDNLTELVINPNDMIESKRVVQFLKLITAQFNCVIVCLLHTGKTTFNSLGNLGSYCDRGAQSTLKVSIDKETNITTLEPLLLRSDLYFNPIAITWNAEEKKHEQIDSTQIKPKSSRKFILTDLSAQDHFNRLGAIFRDSKEIIYGELVEEIKKIYGVGTNIAKQQVIPYLAGNDFLNSIKGVYKFNPYKK